MGRPLWNELRARMGEIRDLEQVVGLLTWDQETYMPAKGSSLRAAQLATLQAILHERLVDPRLGELIAGVEADGELTEIERRMVENLARERRRAERVPLTLVQALAREQSLAVEAWKRAREESDYARFAPHLRTLVALKREQADAIGHDGERYDALLDGYEPGMRTARLVPLFAELRQALVPMVREVVEAAPPPRWRFEAHHFPVDRQWRLSEILLDRMGFDLSRGRLDRSTHPFTSGMGRGDVRLTTRFDERNPWVSIFGTIHEAGHGLYEQNLPEEHGRDPIGVAASMGLHESQSRLWENAIGRSLPFWEGMENELRRLFPDALVGVGIREVQAAACRVERSTIRVDADELTYNLHILLRFELELAMIRGDLAVDDLPAAWNEGMERLLGIVPRNDAEGPLQDIHWAWAEFGYFPSYTLGNLYAAILYQAMRRELGDMDELLRRGTLLPIRDWLERKVHRVGHRYDAEEIVFRATGERLTCGPLLRYLQDRYGPLYGVRFGDSA